MRGRDFELFDYPGEYLEKSDGDRYVATRLEEVQSEFERVEGVADARGFMCGGLFELENYPRDDQNREYLLVTVRHQANVSGFESGTGGSDTDYECRFEAVDSKEPFRTPRSTLKPFVQGPQTAVVVGPSGEEIHTDEYGRVKVQFPLGPLRPIRREQLLLGARLTSAGPASNGALCIFPGWVRR